MFLWQKIILRELLKGKKVVTVKGRKFETIASRKVAKYNKNK